MLGISLKNIPLHIVVGYNGNHLYIITAYFPNTDKFEDDLQTRKEK